MFDYEQDKILETIAKHLYALGKPIGVSTGIHDGLTYGYGHLDHNGFWQFPLYVNPEPYD